MYIPRSFQLGSRTWRVKILKDDQFRTHMHDTDRKWDYENPPRGLCDPNTQIIYLHRDHLSHVDMVHTFYHEVMHALLFSLGQFSNKQHDETTVDAWGDKFAQIMSTMKGENQLE